MYIKKGRCMLNFILVIGMIFMLTLALKVTLMELYNIFKRYYILIQKGELSYKALERKVLIASIVLSILITVLVINANA